MSVRLRNSKRKLTASPERGGGPPAQPVVEGSPEDQQKDPSVTRQGGCQPPFQGGRVEKALKKSPINYFSDLFIIAMVLAWVVVLLVMCIMAVYATVNYADVTIWSDIANLTGIPLSCGGAVWMIKNSVQHAIANNRGEQAKMDFPKVEEAEFSGKEEEAKG